jgi:hypothetical protein
LQDAPVERAWNETEGKAELGKPRFNNGRRSGPPRCGDVGMDRVVDVVLLV